MPPRTPSNLTIDVGADERATVGRPRPRPQKVPDAPSHDPTSTLEWVRTSSSSESSVAPSACVSQEHESAEVDEGNDVEAAREDGLAMACLAMQVQKGRCALPSFNKFAVYRDLRGGQGWRKMRAEFDTLEDAEEAAYAMERMFAQKYGDPDARFLACGRRDLRPLRCTEKVLGS